MYCKFCGAELDDEAKFCTKCGKSTEEAFETDADENNQIDNSKKSLKILIPILVVILLIIVVAVKRVATNNETAQMNSDIEAEDTSYVKSDTDTILNEMETNKDDVIDEDSAAENEDTSDIETAVKSEPIQIAVDFKFNDDFISPEYIEFVFYVGEDMVFTGDLTHKAGTDNIMFGVDTSNRYVKLSPEHINEIRNIFIEVYEKYLMDYQELYHEISIDKAMRNAEHIEGFTDSLQINLDGKIINVSDIDWSMGIWDEGDLDRGFRHATEFIMTATTDGLGDFYDYFASIIDEDAGKEFDYGDYSFIENTIELDTSEDADKQDNNIDTKAGTDSASVIGTFWDPTGFNDAEFTFNADGTGQNFSPSTGKVVYTFTYTVDGNNISVKCKYFTISFTLDGDTLISVDGKYKRK